MPNEGSLVDGQITVSDLGRCMWLVREHSPTSFVTLHWQACRYKHNLVATATVLVFTQCFSI